MPAAAHYDSHGRDTHAVFVQTNRATGNTIKVFEQATDGTSVIVDLVTLSCQVPRLKLGAPGLQWRDSMCGVFVI